MPEYGVCWSSEASEKQEHPTSDLSEEAYQNILGVCEPNPNGSNQDYFVASDSGSLKARISINQIHKQISLAAFGGFSSKPAKGFGGGSLLGYNPISLLTGCKKKSSREEEMAKIRKNDPDAHRSIAWGLSLKGKYKEAIKEFRLYLEKDPKNINAITGLARTYMHQRDFEKAEKTFKKVLQIDPKNVASDLGLGMLYYQKGQLAKAEIHYKRAWEISPTSQAILSYLGNIYLRQGKLEEAVKIYDPYLKKNPGDTDLKKRLAGLYYRIGSNKLDNDEIELGKKALEKAASLDPNYVEPRLILAAYYIKNKEYVKAEKVLNEILKAGTDEAKLESARILLATVYVRSGNTKHLEFTEKVLRNDLKKYPNIAEFHYSLGWVYQKKGDFKAADKEFKRALELRPSLREKYPELKDPKYQP